MLGNCNTFRTEERASRNNSFQFVVQLTEEGRKLIRICNYSGREEEFGREMDWLAPGAGILFRIQ